MTARRKPLPLPGGYAELARSWKSRQESGYSADRAQLQCCGVWTDYPTPGHDTKCPACHSVFTVSGSGAGQ